MSQVVRPTTSRLSATNVSVVVEGSFPILPAPYNFWREGRTLRGDEFAAYEQSCLTAASKRFPGRTIRFFEEEMYAFDWDVFRKAHWASLQSAYESLPGWLASRERPWWLGSDEPHWPGSVCERRAACRSQESSSLLSSMIGILASSQRRARCRFGRSFGANENSRADPSAYVDFHRILSTIPPTPAAVAALNLYEVPKSTNLGQV